MVSFYIRALFYIFILSLFWFTFIIFIASYYLEYFEIHPNHLKIRTELMRSRSLHKSNIDDEHEGLKINLKKWFPVLKSGPDYPHHGANGRGVIIEDDKLGEVNETFHINEFNLVASDMMPLNRTLKDLRSLKCKRKVYPEFLPSTSVIIIFHNEAWSTLLRTLWSVINRSPKELLEEIILVDDASDQDHLGIALENYISQLPVAVYLFRTGNRMGVVKSRLLGVTHAKGAVLTFLDSHCECTFGWLEPLISRVAENRKVVIAPVIDVISFKNFAYNNAKFYKGGFNWRLMFRWLPSSKKDLADTSVPLKTAAIAGGLFSIDREYFYEVGSYDEDLQIWGGENIEMSLRVWQCGGLLEVSLCSRVGHVYREKSPYTFPDGARKTLSHNTLRTVEVWLDEWKYFYYALNPDHRRGFFGDVTSRSKIRRDLKCKSFEWFLKNVYPESAMLYNATFLGEIRNVATKKCFEVNPNKNKDKLRINKCTHQSMQGFMFTKNGRILSADYCLECSNKSYFVTLKLCDNLRENQKFFYNNADLTIKHVATRKCIQNFDNIDPSFPVLGKCNSSNPNQKWMLKNDYQWKQYIRNYRKKKKSLHPNSRN